MIEQLIHARTQELNRINANWDEKVGTVLSAEVKPDTLDHFPARLQGRLLPAAPDQRTSEGDREDARAPLAPPLFRDPREYRAPSE